MTVGQVLEMLSDDPASEADIKSWSARTGHELLAIERNGAVFRFLVRKTVSAARRRRGSTSTTADSRRSIPASSPSCGRSWRAAWATRRPCTRSASRPAASLDGARAKIARLVGGAAGGRHLHRQRHRGQQPRRARCGRAAPGRHVVTSAIEHVSVLNACRDLEKRGLRVTWLPVDGDGPRRSRRRRRAPSGPTRALVSVMAASGEIGTIQAIREIGRLTRRHGVPFHVDGVGAVGRMPLAVDECGIDLLSLSANDLYGPPGAGALWVRPEVRLAPHLLGGGQEGGYRAGTENLPAIVGMGVAADLARVEGPAEVARLAAAARSPPRRPPRARRRRAAHGRPRRRPAAAPREPDRVAASRPTPSCWSSTSAAWPPRRARPATSDRRALARPARHRLRARGGRGLALLQPRALDDVRRDRRRARRAARRRRAPAAARARGERGARRRLVLFDIDGTLITARGAGRSALSRALRRGLRRTGPIDAYDFRGKTDPRIVSDLMRGAGLDDARDRRRARRPASPPTCASWRRSSATASACR